MQNLTVLPLHGGKAPRWLFSRMVRLSSLISDAIIYEYGNVGFVDRLSDPQWFQALACAVGYDWHSSGTTTVLMGALKEALNYNSDIFVAGGKGRQGLLTPEQIKDGADYLSIPNTGESFIEYSKLTAKIDSALIYDNLSIYHHTFVFSKDRLWAVIQQGIHKNSNHAIRFQINNKNVDKKDITKETNNALVSNLHQTTLDLTFEKNDNVKDLSVRLVNEDLRELENIHQIYRMPDRHQIIENLDVSKKAMLLLKHASELKQEEYSDLLKIKGIGRKTLKSLAIIASLIYNDEVYKRDPVVYSYNVGGKDGIPYKINLNDYNDVISSMSEIVKSIKVENKEKEHILKALNRNITREYSQF